MSTSAITASKLTKSFKDNHVLKGIDLNIPTGSVFALLGPNGAGKTTIVRMLSTLLQIDGGEAHVGGFNVKTQADEVRGIIGLTGQFAAVDDKLTGLENLQIIGRLYHISAKDANRRAKELIERFELTDAAKRAAKTYSGGMRRRLDLAASLIITPPIIFLDEPTTGLDPNSRNAVWAMIEELVKEGTTILLTTQYLEEADKLANKIAVIDHGQVIAEGTATELKAKVGHEHLELTLANTAAFEQATTLFSNLSVTSKASDLTMSIALDQGVHQLRSLLDQLDDQKIAIDNFGIHRPTLDDVFLKLTGHQAEEVQPEVKGKKK